MYNEYSGQNSPVMRKFTKREVYETIAMQVQSSTGVVVTSTTKLEETPQQLRHCCPVGGISFLVQYLFDVPSPYGLIKVPYYFCSTCGKLYIFSDFYE